MSDENPFNKQSSAPSAQSAGKDAPETFSLDADDYPKASEEMFSLDADDIAAAQAAGRQPAPAVQPLSLDDDVIVAEEVIPLDDDIIVAEEVLPADDDVIMAEEVITLGEEAIVAELAPVPAPAPVAKPVATPAARPAFGSGSSATKPNLNAKRELPSRPAVKITIVKPGGKSPFAS